MEQPKPNPTKVATKWALINLITGIVLTYAIQYLVPDPNSPIKYLTLLPFVAFLLLAQKEYKDQLGGYLTFGEGFSAGFKFALFTGLMVAVFTYLYLAVLSPDVMEKAVQQAKEQMEAKGNLSSEDIDKAVNITRKFGPIFGAIGALVFDLIAGIIVALIGAAIFKKERSAYDPEPAQADPTV
ncbi:MAG TPA: DUF4199 domain-containing protein [Mucilaginibacter sp.]|jgi:hypothetical protein|nr:DUF4199 domain-containing protein [Mucilaginibacter sp.]